MDHLGYLCAAYTAIWVVILGYFIGLSRRERRIWEEIRAVREQIDKKETFTAEAQREKQSGGMGERGSG